jgi:hypothetical protein
MTKDSLLGTRKRSKPTVRTSSETKAIRGVEFQPYEPTPFEADAKEAYKAVHDRSGPRLRVQADEEGGKRVEVDHPDFAFGQFAFMKAIGVSDIDFSLGLIRQLTNIGSQGSEPDAGGINFVLGVIKGVQPRDQVETMLASQMAAVHLAIMTFARRLAHVDTIPQQDSAQNAFNKLARTFAAQVEALKRYRSGGEQKMTVQHVHVADGGQAIVGNVSTPAPGGGATEKMKEQPHALGYAPGVEMPRQIEAERAPVPRASGTGP